MPQNLAFSDDGIRWTDAPENPVLVGRCDGTTCLIFNPDRDVFMFYRRATINAGEIRRIACSESKDLISWTQPVMVIEHDELDPMYHYDMPVSRYHGVYLGLLHCLHQSANYENHPLPDGMDFRTDTQLAWSRDGIRWERHPARPTFIPVSAPHANSLDWGAAAGVADIVEQGEDIYIYYTAGTHWHRPGFSATLGQGSTLCLATLRKNGFVSVDASEAGGYMVTKPLLCPGGKLHINARTARDGFVKVAVREGEGVRDGEWPTEFRFDKSNAFTGDSLDTMLTWQGQETLGRFPSKTVRLHFWMEKAELYSFWFDD